MIPGKLGLVIGIVFGVWFIKWASSGMGPLGLAFGLLLSAVFLMWLGYMLPKARMILVSVGFFTLMSGTFASYSNWLPQVRGEVPDVEAAGSRNIDEMSVEDRAAWGEEIIFGPGGDLHTAGKGQCPLCHGFVAGALSERAPNLSGIPGRSAERIKDPRYLNPDSVKTESFAGSGRATSGIEYIAESHACPNCFVVAGYGVKGTNDRESPMPPVHKGAIGLSIDELIAVDTWMFFREGEEAPSVEDLRAAYEKFVPEDERQTLEPETAAGAAAAGPPIAMGTDSPQDMIKKMGCAGCHAIPGTDFTTGAVGPVLAEKFTSAKRLASPEYKARVKEGKAHAKTPKEYVIESIMNPSAFVVPAFAFGNPNNSMMPPDFSKKFTYEAVEKLADFLLSQDEAAAAASGIKMDKDGKKG